MSNVTNHSISSLIAFAGIFARGAVLPLCPGGSLRDWKIKGQSSHMIRGVLSALFMFLAYPLGNAVAEEHYLVGVKEQGYLFNNTGELLNDNQLRAIISSKKVDSITLILDKCMDPQRTIDAYIVLNGFGINRISLHINPKQQHSDCEHA